MYACKAFKIIITEDVKTGEFKPLDAVLSLFILLVVPVDDICPAVKFQSGTYLKRDELLSRTEALRSASRPWSCAA